MQDLGWMDFVRAIGLALVIEGALYAAFPDHMRRFMATVLAASTDEVRTSALLSVVAGALLIVVSGMMLL